MANTTLQRVLGDYDQYLTYVRPHRRRFDRNWKLWDGKRVNRQYFGTNDSTDPMTSQMAESIVDNVYGARPQLSFVPSMRVEQEKDTKVIQGLWDFSWDKSNMDLEIMPIGRENEITGVTLVFGEWADGYMCMEHVPIRDCIFDVSARKPSQVRFVGYRRLAMFDDLKDAQRYDTTADDGKGAWVARYKLPSKEQLAASTAGSEDMTDKELKDMYAGSTVTGKDKDGKFATNGQVEIIYMVYLDKVVEVLNRRHVIAEFDTPYKAPARKVKVQKHDEQGQPMVEENQPELEEAAIVGQLPPPEEAMKMMRPVMHEIEVPEIKPYLPVAWHRGFVDPAQLLSKSSVDFYASLQEDLNDLINEKKDNLAYSVQNVGLVDDTQAGELIPQLSIAKPGSLIPARGIQAGQEPVQWVDKPTMAPDIDIEIQRVKQSIRDTARVAEFSQGIDTQGENPTATQVNAQTAGASASFGSRTRTLESGLYKSLGEMFVKMVQTFLTEPQLVRVIGVDGIEFKAFDPDKFWGEYDVKVVLETQAKAKQREDAQMALQAYQTLGMDPAFNHIELAKRVAQKAFGMDDDDLKLIMNPNPMNQAMMGGMPTGDVAAGAAPAPASPPPGVPSGY